MNCCASMESSSHAVLQSTISCKESWTSSNGLYTAIVGLNQQSLPFPKFLSANCLHTEERDCRWNLKCPFFCRTHYRAWHTNINSIMVQVLKSKTSVLCIQPSYKSNDTELNLRLKASMYASICPVMIVQRKEFLSVLSKPVVVFQCMVWRVHRCSHHTWDWFHSFQSYLLKYKTCYLQDQSKCACAHIPKIIQFYCTYPKSVRT